MTQELLDLTNVGATFQEVSGVVVTQRVWRDVLSDPGPIGRFGDDAHDVIVIKWTTRSGRDKFSADCELCEK